MTRFGLLALAISALAISAPAARAADGKTPGLVTDKPADGTQFVKTDQGYMVPFTFNIPGTEASIDFVPIPGGKFKMGSPDSEAKRGKDEGPQFEVEVEPFWMA